MSTDATLPTTLSGPGPLRRHYNGDVFLVARWPLGMFERCVAEKDVSLAAAYGLTYRIVEMSYRPPKGFELRVEVR
jgi:hypothetical protein